MTSFYRHLCWKIALILWIAVAFYVAGFSGGQKSVAGKGYICGDVGNCINDIYGMTHGDVTIVFSKGTYTLTNNGTADLTFVDPNTGFTATLPPHPETTSTDYCKYLQDDCGASPMFCGGAIGKEAALKEFCPPKGEISAWSCAPCTENQVAYVGYTSAFCAGKNEKITSSTARYRFNFCTELSTLKQP